MSALPTATEPVTLDEAIRFIWTETEILDRLAYREWLPLWTKTGLYVVPIDRDGGDPVEALNIVYDGAEMREARVKRLLSGFSMSSAPPARTARTTSRFVLESAGAGTARVRCAQILIEYKYGRTRTLGADLSYDLRRADDGTLRIERKVVQLLNSDDHLFGIGYLL
ncbi:MAG TPA: aromatic-ring-hydroxylating dioxygenase subunit beta [Sphingomonadaceae bacterium]|nr:aromatic-ring-hydroxylating dioxygenase subunit beta [Sphingomonadaceae bacterium]